MVLEDSSKRKDVLRQDRISELPDEILGHILSSIQTRDSVRTSILSKRWRNVWASVPVIEINDRHLSNTHQHRDPAGIRLRDFGESSFISWFMNFMDRVLWPSTLGLSYEISCLRRLHLSCDFDYDMSRISKWLDAVTRLDDIEELDLRFSERDYSRFSHSGLRLSRQRRIQLNPGISTCKKLVSLKLNGNVMLNLPSSFCLPSLKDLHLIDMKFLDVDLVKNFLTGCPVLEDLRIQRYSKDEIWMRTLYLQSSSLKSLQFHTGVFRGSGPLLKKMVIDATNLERLDLSIQGKEQIIVNSSMSSLLTVKLDVQLGYLKSLGDCYAIEALEVLRKMSNTKYLCLSSAAIASLEHRGLDYLPMFKNLMNLEVHIFSCSWPNLNCLFENSPNLNRFLLFKDNYNRCKKPKPHQQYRTPNCLMLNLEEIELSGFGGCEEDEIEMVSHFLKNAPALKKMSIYFEYTMPENLSDFHSKVFKLPKASTACEIYIIWS